MQIKVFFFCYLENIMYFCGGNEKSIICHIVMFTRLVLCEYVLLQ